MLFDLQSPRRRVFIKIVYGGLAALLGGGLVLFGIGGDVSGGLLDGLGVGGDGSTGTSFEKQIEDAEKKVAANPNDPEAKLELVRVNFLAGNDEIQVDPETGATQATEGSQQYFQRAADAWDLYLKGKPTPPSSDIASLMSQAYVHLAESSTSANEALNNIKGAVGAQVIVATAMPSVGSYSNLALYQFFSGDTAGGDASAAQATALAQASQKSELKQQLAQFKKGAAAFQKQVKEAAKQAETGAPGANPLEAPGGGLEGGGLGGLGGGSLGGP